MAPLAQDKLARQVQRMHRVEPGAHQIAHGFMPGITDAMQSARLAASRRSVLIRSLAIAARPRVVVEPKPPRRRRRAYAISLSNAAAVFIKRVS
jgi:hypothetical protein